MRNLLQAVAVDGGWQEQTLQNFPADQDLIEYALIAGLIALAAIAGIGYIAVEINSAFSAFGAILIGNLA